LVSSQLSLFTRHAQLQADGWMSRPISCRAQPQPPRRRRPLDLPAMGCQSYLYSRFKVQDKETGTWRGLFKFYKVELGSRDTAELLPWTFKIRKRVLGMVVYTHETPALSQLNGGPGCNVSARGGEEACEAVWFQVGQDAPAVPPCKKASESRVARPSVRVPALR
jgi:hypothetical protein